MSHSSTALRILLGLPHNEGRPLLNLIARRRFNKRVGSWQKRPYADGIGYIYDGNRCSDKSVADRFSGYAFRPKLLVLPWEGFRGKLRYAWAVVTTLLGFQDHKIESTWHERARADWWYLNEKVWDI